MLVPASGGGLVSGIAIAVKAVSPRSRIVAVQPEATGTLRASRPPATPEAAAPVPSGATIADALTAPAIGELCLRVCANASMVVHVSEEEIRAGMRFLYERAKLACARRAPPSACRRCWRTKPPWTSVTGRWLP